MCRRFQYYSQNEWTDNIIVGKIKLNGEIVSPEYILLTQDVISFHRPASEEPDVDRWYEVLFEDDHVMVVVKSGDLPVCESGRYVLNTLLNIIKEERGYNELFAVQRLDKETSGVLVIAKNKVSAAKMGEIISAYEHNKEYHAVLYGTLPEPEVTVDAPLGKAGDSSIIRIRQKVVTTGKPAKTDFKSVWTDGRLTLAKVVTYTGRTHQIRCHAEYIGCPLAGDKLYGKEDEDFLQLMKHEKPYWSDIAGEVDRQLLHASWLSFPHPVTGERMEFSSDYRPFFTRYPKIEAFLRPLPPE